jgi:glutathione S-transferase
MGIAPVIEDGDLVLGESGAICDYLCAKYGKGGALSPGADDPDYADHLFWFHWSNGTFMATLMMQLAVTFTGGDASSGFWGARAQRCWEMCEARLGEAPFFGGRNLTTADIMMGYILTTSRAFRNMSVDHLPNVKAYIAKIAARPAYQAAMAKAEPGMPLGV